MTADQFVTAPSTPEVDALKIVVEQRLGQEGGGGGEGGTMTIFRVPAHVREASKALYEPRLVSIGPYHRGREALRAMEQHKWRYLRELVAIRPEASVADYVAAVRAVEGRARRCYSERTSIIDSAAAGEGGGGNEHGADEFAEMLLLDGCFVLQLFIKWHNEEPDELIDVGWGLNILHSDLLLLENQIPFFVLEALFSVVAPNAERFKLRTLILRHLSLDDSILFKLEVATEVTTPPEIHHLLHLFYEAISLPRRRQQQQCCPAGSQSQQQPPPPPPPPPPVAVPSVTLLRGAGVRFERNASPRHALDVTFDPATGVMRMPRVEVDHANKPLLVNLVAFEQTAERGPGAARPLSSYAALMASLVRTGRDVAALQRRGVVDNLLDGDDDAAAGFFQKLGDCATLDYNNHLFFGMFLDLNAYYRSSWRRHRARFLSDHCSSPWAMVALAAGVFAFCFALVKFSTVVYGLCHPTRH